uniref:Uncharacterized protein n=1 Tax=Sphingobacterium sp. (strain 21) TaxID=743722 RepID=F4CCG3_SPHS2
MKDYLKNLRLLQALFQCKYVGVPELAVKALFILNILLFLASYLK